MYEQVGLFEPVPRDELLGRIDALKTKMAASGVDFALLVQNVDRFYFTGTMQKGTAVVPLEGEPLLFIEKSVERARKETPLSITSVEGDREVGRILDGKGMLKGVAGLELDVLPVTLFEKIRKVIGVDRYTNIAPSIKEVRAVKSPFEVEQIRKSGEIMTRVFAKAPEIIREGLTEVEIDARLVAEGRAIGHQGFLRMRGINQEMMTITVTSGFTSAVSTCAELPIAGAGLTPAVPQGSTLKKVERGIPVLVDYGGGYNGYITDETRVFVGGEMEEAFKKPYETSRAIIDDVIANAKAGVDSTEVFGRALRIAQRAGMEDYFMGYREGKVSFIAHGLGLEINELPIITGTHRMILREGMVFALEPKFVLPGKGAIGVEVDLIVRENGSERVTKDSLDIVYF
jgi:Xaa-Pro aminopeptidase